MLLSFRVKYVYDRLYTKLYTEAFYHYCSIYSAMP